MALVLADRVQQSGTANTTVSFTLSGSVAGFQSFAVVGNGNTTYYAATDASGNWEAGIGTYSTSGPTLTRTTILSSSNSGSAVTFSGTVNVFVTYPSGKSVNQDANGRVSIPYITGSSTIGSLNVGDATTADTGMIAAFTAGETTYLYTSLQNTSSSNTSYGAYAVNNNNRSAYVEIGANNSAYSFSAAGYPNNKFSAASAVFLESSGGPLAIGTWDSQAISFIINGSVSTTDAVTINTNGSVAFNGQVGTAGQALQSNATSAPTWGTLGVVGGGTGLTTLTANNVILGNGTSTPLFVAPSTAGNVLTSNGTTWQSTAPAASGASKGQAIAFSLVFGL